jgi:hypothetical protein
MLIAKTGDRDIDNNFKDVDDRLRALAASPLLLGKQIDDVELEVATSTPIRHQLGRKPKGYFVVDMTGATTAGFLNTDDSDDLFLTLTATDYGATITVSLWVY